MIASLDTCWRTVVSKTKVDRVYMHCDKHQRQPDVLAFFFFFAVGQKVLICFTQMKFAHIQATVKLPVKGPQ